MSHQLWELQSKQAAPLSVKIGLTKQRIREWVYHWGEDNVYVSFSGGKDSTVLLTIARELFPNIKAVFFDTGLEYPEIREFVSTWDNVDWIKPKMNFKKVIEKYGYPFISKEVSECVCGAQRYLAHLAQKNAINFKPNDSCATDHTNMESQRLKAFLDWNYKETIDNVRIQRMMGILPKTGKATIESIPDENNRSKFSCERYQFLLDAPFPISERCCNVMKKWPSHKYTKETGRMPITAQMACESRLRTTNWLNNGCNAFDSKNPASHPMAFWTEQDVLLYILQNRIPIATIYGDVVRESNGVEGQLSFSDLGLLDTGVSRLRTTGYDRTGCMFCGYGIHVEKSPNRFERMKQTHPKQYEYIMKPWDEGGLGYKDVIDWINEHGDMDIKY